MIRFLSPWWLLLVLLVVALAGAYVLVQLRRKTYAVRFSNVGLLSRLAPRGPGWRRHLAATAFLLCLLVLATAMAKPSADVRVPLERATIVLALDVSLSMQATDVTPNRIEASKAAAKLFVNQLPDTYNIGLVSFAKSASVKVSPTKDHNQIIAGIDALQLQESTAIGEAIFTSLDAIASVPADGASGPPPARIVLLSDGYTTFGRPNDLAAAAAKKAKVPVSTIAFGTQEGTVELSGRQVPVPVDRDALHKLATDTSGQYYDAVTSEGLKKVYNDLGSSIGYRTESREITQWFAGLALLFGFAGAVLSLIWTQRLP
ncbi:VWA domain-containing protein [Fodinicola acaciae]|uniref:VWA domain-containing protein n=1 Tax=Fodinicola acaciae TaxID=2681555 RepID=UPI0013D2F9A2|nr:VWA domain-containing protein [Fodinicola acaciae]